MKTVRPGFKVDNGILLRCHAMLGASYQITEEANRAEPLYPTWRLLDALSLLIWSPALHKAQTQGTQSCKVTQVYNREPNHYDSVKLIRYQF
jgi:hypothetical protein